LLAIDARDQHRYAESAALYARAYALVPFDPGVSLDYGEFLLETNRPRYALAIGQRVLRQADMWTNAHAVTLLLNATARVWGVDSVLAAAERLNARRPSARAALFVGMAYEARGDTSAANAAYRAGLRISPGDSALSARALRRSNQHE
jgi:tetratricopeptide (TPR) repeat protein